MRAAVLAAFAVTGALLAVSPVALAGWSAPQRIEREPFPEPRVGFEEPAGDAAPWAVRFRGGETVAVPGSEGAEEVAVAIGPRGLVAFTWTSDAECPGAEDDPGCLPRVLATVWRRGEAPPPARVVSREGTDANEPFAVIGRDGTLVIAWTIGDTDGVDAAVARGEGPFAVAPVMAGARLYHAALVRREPQLAMLGVANARTTISLAGASEGRLRPPRVEARLPGSHDGGLALFRSGRGARLLTWTERGELHFRAGAPGRRLGPVRRRRAADYDAALGERGDFALVLRDRQASGELGPLRVLRGRAGRRRLREDVLPPGDPASGFDADVAVDAVGTAYAVWHRPGTAGSEVFGAVAPRGRRFGRGRRLSSPGVGCLDASVVVTGARRVAARWSCVAREGRFAEGARYTRGG